MWSSLRKATASAVCFSLIATCAGFEPYAAFGASLNRAEGPAPVRVLALATSLPALPPAKSLPALPAAAVPSAAVPSAAVPSAVLPSAVLRSAVLPSAVPSAAVPSAAVPSAVAPSAAAPAAAVIDHTPVRSAAGAFAAAAPSAAQPAAETLKARADARFDGAAQAPESAAAPVAAPAAASSSAPRPALARPSRLQRARKALAVAAMAVTLSLSGVAAHYGAQALPLSPSAVAAQAGPTGMPQAPPAAPQQPAPQQPAQPQSSAPQAAPDTAQAPIVLSRDVSVSARFDAQDMKVGERLHLIVTVTNQTDKPMTVVGLAASVQDALPEALELEAPQAAPGAAQASADPAITLRPGETRQVSYEVIPFDSGELKVEGPITVTVQAPGGESRDLDVALPAQALKVRSILTPDWKQKGFRDVAPVMKRVVPEWVWVAALPLLLVLMIGVERILAAQKEFPRAPREKLPLIARSRQRLAALGGKLDEPERVFYAEYDSILTNFLVDFHGLRTAERAPADLARELKKIRSLTPGQLKVAKDLLLLAEDARFSGRTIDAVERRRDLANLEDLIDSIAGRVGSAPSQGGTQAGNPRPGADTLSGAAGLEFGHPLALLLFVPLIARAVWAFVNRHKKNAFTVSDGSALPRKRSLRQRLQWLPRTLRYLAVASILLGLAQPELGVRRDVVWRPSTDTMVEFDISGSMDESVGQNLTKLQAAEDAVHAYVDLQRRGTDNRVGLGTFSDDPYLDVRLTTDYDALIAHLKELHTVGSTSIGKAMLDATAHFIELNITELSDPNDPRMAQAQKLLREQGLPAVLEWAKQYPDLMQKILRPDRAKVVVVFSDGDSNNGITPHDAAEIAKSLGVKIYTVYIGNNGGSGESALQEVAQLTGAKHFRAADPDAMRDALLEVDRLEKSPSRIVSHLALQDYSRWFILAALLALGLEVALANTRLRALQAMLFLSLPLGTLPGIPQNVVNPPAIVAQVSGPSRTGNLLPVTGVPKEVAAANLLYNEGRYDEALKAYDEALRRYPDQAELYFNMGNAYFRLGELDKAAASYQRFLGKTQDKALTSRAVYNLSMIALAKKDGQQAKDLLKEALRRDPANEDARWNLEVINRLQKQQQQNQQNQQQNKKQRKKGGKPSQQNQSQNQNQNQSQNQQNQNSQNQQSQQGDQKGQQKAQPQDGKDQKKGAEQLADKLGEQQKEQKDAANKAITRKGHDAWGALALPLAAAGGTALQFSAPLWAWGAAVAAPVVALLLAYGVHKRLQAARRLSPGTAPRDFRSWWGRKRFIRKAGLVTTAAALLTLAAAGPQSGYQDERVNFGGKDVIVAVDGSNSSIYAEDARFANTKKELSEFAERLQGTDRVGLVVFAGEARTSSPLSVDYGNLQFKADRLELESRGLKQGTSLADAVQRAAAAFETAKDIGPRDRILVIISDGEDFGEDLNAAIDAARQHHITIYAIGVGSERGVRMKVPTEDGTGTQYVQDDQTNGDALTKLNDAPLRKLASATGGAYFRGGDGATLAKVMAKVAEENKGDHGQTIRSPRNVAQLFLWPALALLMMDLLLPGFSVIRRERKPGKKSSPAAPKRGGTPLRGAAFAFLGLSALPLSSWAVILPFAVLTTILGGLLAADLWTDGALTRRLVWSLQRRRSYVQKGVAADLGRLFDVREIDDARLARFLALWQSAKDADRGALLAAAAADPELAREKLIAAYLSGAGDPALAERALTELGRVSRRQLKPAGPLVARILERRGELSWLRHGDAAKALGRLASAFLEPAQAAQARRDLGLDRPAPSWTPSVKGLKRALLGLSLVVALGSLTLVGASGYKTARYVDEQGKASQATTQIFFSEDSFIFGDRYVDDRIPTMVLPALRRWSQSTPGAQADLERAITILAGSPDPKADNILEAILRRSDLMPLTDSAETRLLTSLVARDDQQVWVFMDQLLKQGVSSPTMEKRLERMLVICLQAKNPRAFENAFHFLKTSDETLQGFAANAIYARLLAYVQQGQFYDKLGAVQARYAGDPETSLWVERFLMIQAAGGKEAGYDASKAVSLLDKVLDAGKAYDMQRGPTLVKLAAAAAQAKQVSAPSQGGNLQAGKLPSLVDAEIASLGQAAADDSAPQAVKELAKHAVNRTTTQLIQEAEAAIPGLHEQLIADGVVLPDTQAPSYYRGYEDYEGYEGYGSGGSSKNYRELYKLEHLRALQADIEAKAAEIKTNIVDTPAFVELMDRARQLLPDMQEAGKAAGMLDGGSMAEKAADQVNGVLAKGASAFTGDAFLKGLRARGLAPDNGASSGEARFLEAYTLEQMQGVRRYLYELAVSGNGFDYNGKARPLSVDERKFLVGALDSLARAAAADYKAAPPRNEAAPASLAVAKLSLAAAKAAGHADQERALLRQLAAVLAQPGASTGTAEEVADAVHAIFEGVTDPAGRLALLGELSRAMDGAAGPRLASAAADQLKKEFHDTETALSNAFNGFGDEAVAAGVRPSGYTDFAVLKQAHLRRLAGVVDKMAAAAQAKGPLNEEQKKAVARAKSVLPVLEALAPKAGLLPGDTRAELAADTVNPKVYDVYMKFYGQVIKRELIKRGLAPDNGKYDAEQGYLPSYSKADLDKLLSFLQGLKDSGQGWADDNARRPLTDDEKQVLDAAIKAVRSQLRDYPGEKTTLHGAAVLGLAPLAMVFGTWTGLLLAGAAVLGFWLLERFFGGSGDEGEAAAPARGVSAQAAARAKRVELAAKKLASSVAGGSFRSLFIGAGGTDFAESRPYAGEDVRDVDWKASAKMGEIYSKKYELEKELPLVLVIDVSGSGAFGTRGEEKRAVIEEVSSVLALAAAQLNVRVGAVLVSDKVEAYIPPKNGSQQAREIIRRVQEQPEQGRTDLRPALDLALKELRSRAMIAVVSDFLAPDFRGALASLSKRHDVRAIRVADPAELAPLPPVGLLAARDGETGELRDLDTSNRAFRAEHAALIERRENRLSDAFSQARLRPLTLSTEGDYLQDLQDAFDPKAQAARSMK